MPWKEMIPILVPSLIVMVGWIVSHQFAAWRDRANKRREQRVVYLLDAFRSLSKANHHPKLHEVADDLERALYDMQLLGNEEQISEAQKLMQSLKDTNKADLDPALYAISKELRKDLGRRAYKGQFMWLKIFPK